MMQQMIRIILAVLLFNGINTSVAQQILFEQTLAEKEVPENAKLQASLRTQYAVTRYVKQPDFIKPSDFLVMVTPSLVLKSRFQKMAYYPTGSFSYVGKLEGDIPGEVSFSKYQDKTAGMIILNDGRKFIIDQTGENYFSISQTREDIFTEREKIPDYLEPPFNREANSSLAPLATQSICNTTSTCPGSSVIDLMVVYSPLAESSWGGSSNTVAQITQAVTNMNTAMVNSGVNNVSYRLVKTQKVNYTESGSFSTDLDRLSGTNDGFIDEVHTLRDQVGADLVSLIIGSPTSSCGIGWLNTSSTGYSASNGFNVTLYSCAVGNFTMSHEFGHNMGLRHDWYVDGSITPCSHHHGYSNRTAIAKGTSSTSSERWRTIMAYNNECSAAGFTCTRINRWSNPNLTYNNDATGVAIGLTNPSDEAYAFYRMACLVAAFRADVPACAAPTGLTASSITLTEATVSWSAVTGGISYDVEYTTNLANSWSSAVSATTATSYTFTGLNNKTTYYWRVRTNCSDGSSTYTQAQFTTLPPCPTPASLSSGSITTTSTVLSWGAVSGALHYTVDFKVSSAANWTNRVTDTVGTNVNLSGLMAGTAYQWRVLATCSGGAGNYAQGNFTTLSPPVCADNYENNNSSSTAKIISLGTTGINANISSGSDVDWFKFTTPNSTATNVRVTLSNLPKNYNVELYNKSLVMIGFGTATGTTNEIITLVSTAKKATYFVRVFPNDPLVDFTTGSCYKLVAESSATQYDLPTSTSDLSAAPALSSPPASIRWRIYPVPARSSVHLYISSETPGTAQVQLHDWTGRLLLTEPVDIRTGLNDHTLSLRDIPSGIYIMKMISGKTLLTEKLMIQH